MTRFCSTGICVHRCQPPEFLSLLPLPPYQSQGTAPAARSGFCYCVSTRNSQRPSLLILYLCTYLGLAPPAVYWLTTSLISIMSLYCYVCVCSKILKLQKCTPKAMTFTDACGPRLGPIYSHWPASLGSPTVSPHSCSWAWLKCWLLSLACTTGLSCSKSLQLCTFMSLGQLFHCPHCHACTHRETLHLEESMLTDGISTASNAHTVVPDP